MVFDFEQTGHAAGDCVSQLSICVSRHNAFEYGTATVDDDMDRRHRLIAVAGERGITVINSAVDSPAETVIVGRDGQDFDLVDDSRYAFDVAHTRFGL